MIEWIEWIEQNTVSVLYISLFLAVGFALAVFVRRHDA